MIFGLSPQPTNGCTLKKRGPSTDTLQRALLLAAISTVCSKTCFAGQEPTPPVPLCVVAVVPIPQPNEPPRNLADLLWNRNYRKSQKELVEATNAARVFMSCIGAKDYDTSLGVLKNNEKLFNKVFKGWLQKANDYPVSKPPVTLGGYYMPRSLPVQIAQPPKSEGTTR